MTKHILQFKVFIFFALLSQSALATTDSVRLEISLLNPDFIAASNFDGDTLFSWVADFSKSAQNFLETQEGDFQAGVLVTFNFQKPANIDIGICPKNETMRKALLSELAKFEELQAKFCEYSLFFAFTGGDGCAKNVNLAPELKRPSAIRQEAFYPLSIEEKVVELKRWASEQILPLIGNELAKTDANFEGVKRFGDQLKKGIYKELPQDSVITFNPNYWRAMLEMEPGNQFVPIANIFTQVANGNLEGLQIAIPLSKAYSFESEGIRYLIDELTWRYDIFKEHMTAAINRGIDFHDEGDYTGAVQQYTSILDVYPYSAWANYELYFSNAEMNQDSSLNEQLWETASDKIFGNDPLYNTTAKIKTGKQAFLFSQRNQVETLFAEKDSLVKDVLKLADIYLDHDEFTHAAELYWLLAAHHDPIDMNNRDLVPYFLYCMDKLGMQSIINFFEESVVQEFPIIDKERQDRMERNFMYQAFETKE